MVAVAQLVEPWIVIPVVAGSIPVSHPNFFPSALDALSEFGASHCIATLLFFPDKMTSALNEQKGLGCCSLPELGSVGQ